MSEQEKQVVQRRGSLSASSSAASSSSAGSMLDAETRAEALSLIGGLARRQVAAFEALTSGGSIAGAARAAGVARKTVYVWLGEGHAFGEAYRQWKASIAETARTRLLMVGEAATVQIAKAVRQGDTKAALAVAKGMGLLAPPAVGPALVQIEARKREAEAERAEIEGEDRRGSWAAFKDLVDVEEITYEIERADEDEGEGDVEGQDGDGGSLADASGFREGSGGRGDAGGGNAGAGAGAGGGGGDRAAGGGGGIDAGDRGVPRGAGGVAEAGAGAVPGQGAGQAKHRDPRGADEAGAWREPGGAEADHGAGGEEAT